MAIRITGIRKAGGNPHNPHEAVSHYRWVEDGTNKGDITDRPTVVGWLDDKGITAYVLSGRQVWCQVRENAHGTRFLQTVADNYWQDNLLSLPEV